MHRLGEPQEQLKVGVKLTPLQGCEARWVKGSGESQVVQAQELFLAHRANSVAESCELPRVTTHRYAASRRRVSTAATSPLTGKPSAPAIRCIVSRDGAA